MRILMVTSEVAPFAKVGGLGDMVAALAKVIAKRGHEVRIVCPKYGSITTIDESWNCHDEALAVCLGKHLKHSRLWETVLPGSRVCVNFLEFDQYFLRPEIYSGPWGSHGDNGERFAFLSRAALDLCYALNWTPDVIHCHDWPTGLVPVYLHTCDFDGPLSQTASVLTIHNLNHQGIFGRELLDFAGIPQSTFRADCLESMGHVNILKGAIYNATKVTTVSPSYAQEIQTAQYGCGLNYVLKFKAGDLVGILNGVDLDLWNPLTDKYIPAPYSAANMSGKARCKTALQQRFDLELDPNVPIFATVARFCDQKGLDLLVEILPGLMSEMAIQVVVLGSGDPYLEHTFSELSGRYSDRFGVYVGYNEALAHVIEAGADFFVMPSRYEPCGLNQMYSMIYGTLPIVRAIGGLRDTVDQYIEGQGKGSGFLFDEPTAHALYYTIGWACATYYDRPEEFQQLRCNAMQKVFSWEKSADAYEQVYSWASDACGGSAGL